MKANFLGATAACLFAALNSGWALAECPPTDQVADVEKWLPDTPEPKFDETPPPHPEPDCPFYLAAWQNFLFDTKSDPNGKAAFLSWRSIETLFDINVKASQILSLAPRSIELPNDASQEGVVASLVSLSGNGLVLDGGIEQAGNAAILFDQQGYPVYYGIHVNDAFAKFLKDNNINNKEAIESADQNIAFTEGVVELKSAWRVLTKPSDFDTFIQADAEVPTLRVIDDKIQIDKSAPSRKVKLGLLALHVVFVLKGHPEFIWSTFEHTDLSGETDLGPSSAVNPDANGSGPPGSISPFDYLLYHGGDIGTVANEAPGFSEQAAAFNESTQRLDKGSSTPRSVYRAYPAAKATTIDLDQDVIDLNTFLFKRFQNGVLPETDKRRFYRLVGATWLDKPAKTFELEKSFVNAPGESSDDGPVAGEDALSSLAMESFTQGIAPNCFSCHDTKKVTTKRVKLLDPKLLNVSHALSKYVSEH